MNKTGFIRYFGWRRHLEVEVAPEETTLLTRHFATSALDFRRGGFYRSHVGRVAVTSYLQNRCESGIDHRASLLEATPAEAFR